MKRRAVMALLATVVPRGCCELAFVHVAMAIDALRELDLEARVTTCWSVAGGAGDFLVREGQREAGLCMECGREYGWAPSIDVMAALATASVQARCELTTVRIGLMAVGACGMRNRRLEVAVAVAIETANGQVLAEQREVGF